MTYRIEYRKCDEEWAPAPAEGELGGEFGSRDHAHAKIEQWCADEGFDRSMYRVTSVPVDADPPSNPHRGHGARVPGTACDCDETFGFDDEGNAHCRKCGTVTPAAVEPSPLLPHGSAERKRVPIVTGVLDYMPDAISWAAETPVYPASDDFVECMMRRGESDDDGRAYSVIAFRLALLQLQSEVTPTGGIHPADSAAYTGTFGDIESFFESYARSFAAVARVSFAGNEKHNPGQAIHHARSKSTDHENAAMRHWLERGRIDPDTGCLTSAELVWRTGILAQLELEAAGASMARGARP